MNGGSLEQTLTSVPSQEWKVAQAIILDWHDGPREGVCAFAIPHCCFFFQLLAESAYPEDRSILLQLSELALDTMEQLTDILQVLGAPQRSVWIPIWRFPDLATQTYVEQQIDHLLQYRRLTPIVIATEELETFTGCWVKNNLT